MKTLEGSVQSARFAKTRGYFPQYNRRLFRSAPDVLVEKQNGVLQKDAMQGVPAIRNVRGLQ
jgi:hypothetical protein